MIAFVRNSPACSFDKAAMQSLAGLCFSILLEGFFIPNSPFRIPHFEMKPQSLMPLFYPASAPDPLPAHEYAEIDAASRGPVPCFSQRRFSGFYRFGALAGFRVEDDTPLP